MIGLFERNIAAGILILLILLLRRGNRRLPGRYFTLLWGIAALRLLLPFSMKISVPSAVAAIAATLGIAVIPKEFSPGAAERTAGESLFPLLYGAAALAVFLGFLFRHFWNRRGYREAIPCTNGEVSRFLSAAAPRRNVKIRISDRIAAPLTYGLFRPVILLPKAVLEDREGLELILAHELNHIRRGDLAYKLLLVAAVSLGWLNPLAWVMLILANRDLEFACDEAVLKRYPEKKADYARLLIRTEERKSSILSGAFSTNAVKERIERMMKFKKATVIGSIAAAVTAAASLAVFVSAETAKNTNVQWYVGGEDGELTPISEEEAFDAMNDEDVFVYSFETDVSDERYTLSVNENENEGEPVVITGSDGGEEGLFPTEDESVLYYKIDEDGGIMAMSEEEYEEMKKIFNSLTESEPASSTCVEAEVPSSAEYVSATGVKMESPSPEE